MGNTAPDEADELGVIGLEIEGRYRVERFIGAGTMGAVYEGKQLAVGRRVAIKLLNAAMKTHKQVRERFRIEAQAIATLTHPNCVTLYDFGYAEEVGSLYMAVEYLDGITLDAHIVAGLDANTALALSRQVADVLVAAHAAGIMHRDLKPENVMVVRGADGSPQAKVLDFGLARIFEDATGNARLTRQGQLFGTPAYMSPEQCVSTMDVGPPCDIYALGVSMFEMLMGRLPFESSSVPELLVLHSTKTAPPVVVEQNIPLEVSSLVARMMAKSPEDRPTAEEARDVLDAVLDGRPIPPLRPIVSTSQEFALPAPKATVAMSPDTSRDATASAVAVPLRRSMAVPVLIVAVVLLVAALGVATSIGDDEPSPEPESVAVVVEPTAIPEEPIEDEMPLALAPDVAIDDGALVAAQVASASKAIIANRSEPAAKTTRQPLVIESLPRRESKREQLAAAARAKAQERAAKAQERRARKQKTRKELQKLGSEHLY